MSERVLTAYNLTIENLHTYYVGSGSMLVSNTACGQSGAANGEYVSKLLGPDGAGVLCTAERVGSGLKNHIWHRLADWAVDGAVEHGRVFRVTGKDGVPRVLVQTLGEAKQFSGRFEWIVDGGKVTHEMFVRGGRINGIRLEP